MTDKEIYEEIGEKIREGEKLTEEELALVMPVLQPIIDWVHQLAESLVAAIREITTLLEESGILEVLKQRKDEEDANSRKRST